MSKKKSIILLLISVLLLIFGGYAFFIDPIIGIIGILCGLWSLFLAILGLRGKGLFKDPKE